MDDLIIGERVQCVYFAEGKNNGTVEIVNSVADSEGIQRDVYGVRYDDDPDQLLYGIRDCFIKI